MGREIYPEISTGLWCVIAVTGNQNGNQKAKYKIVADFENQEDLFII
jgi:hypothetical protein